jgi:hypothetical protein
MYTKAVTVRTNKRVPTTKACSLVNFHKCNHSKLSTSLFCFDLPPFVDAQIIKCIAQGKVTRKDEVK